VPLASGDDSAPVEATSANVYSGAYPLSRLLYVYVNKSPKQPLDPLVREFVKFVFSREGQELVIKDGYLPLPANVVKDELAKID
jgi:phosphate transport system substrate-binding protein